jgi:hypothetical protein
MSEENVEVVRRRIAAWSSGDDEAALQDIDPEIVWQLPGIFPGFESEYRGHAGVRRFWKAFLEPWESIAIESQEVTELDQGRLLVRFRESSPREPPLQILFRRDERAGLGLALGPSRRIQGLRFPGGLGPLLSFRWASVTHGELPDSNIDKRQAAKPPAQVETRRACVIAVTTFRRGRMPQPPSPATPPAYAGTG